MKKSMLAVIALAAALPTGMSTLVRADEVKPVALTDSELERVTAGASASITTTGSATANGLTGATLTAGNTTATSNGTTAVAGGSGAGLAGSVGGSTGADASFAYSADGGLTMVFNQTHTTNAPSWSTSYTIAAVLTTDLPRLP